MHNYHYDILCTRNLIWKKVPSSFSILPTLCSSSSSGKIINPLTLLLSRVCTRLCMCAYAHARLLAFPEKKNLPLLLLEAAAAAAATRAHKSRRKVLLSRCSYKLFSPLARCCLVSVCLPVCLSVCCLLVPRTSQSLAHPHEKKKRKKGIIKNCSCQLCWIHIYTNEYTYMHIDSYLYM